MCDGLDVTSPSPVFLLQYLSSQISSYSQATLRQVLNCVPPPIDGARVGVVVGSIAACLEKYSCSVASPTVCLTEIVDRIDLLAMEVAKVVRQEDWPAELEQPTYRSLRRFPVWALLQRVCPEDLANGMLASIGAELATSFLLQKPFTKSFAVHLIETLNGQGKLASDGFPVWQKKAARILATASPLFRHDMHSAVSEIAADGFLVTLKEVFRARIEFARDTSHQGVADHRSQDSIQLRRSARWLKERVEAGDEKAMAMMIGILAGVPMSLVLDMPVLGPRADDWLMALDVSDGCLKASIELFASGRASIDHGDTGALRAAGDIIVKPLPRFLAAALTERQQEYPDAVRCGELLGNPDISSRHLTCAEDDGGRSGLKPTVARFSNGLASHAVGIGVDRYLAALITNDNRIVPSGKFFYAQARRNEIWLATQKLYDDLGWGEPVELVDGLAVGSMIVPTDATIMKWLEWMVAEVDAVAPGRHGSLDRLIEHHNRFAMACASIASFFLALRGRNPIALSAMDCIGGSEYATVCDKRSGLIRGAFPIPMSDEVRAQLKLWLAHCSALERRLNNLDVDTDAPVRRRLREVCAGRDTPAFFRINWRRGTHAMATRDIEKWWPKAFRLAGNSGRHYWQVTLREEGVDSSMVDAFVRHHTQGSDFRSSSSSKIPSEIRRCLLPVVTTVACRLGFTPIPGLVKGA